jgi:hypothetical protein
MLAIATLAFSFPLSASEPDDLFSNAAKHKAATVKASSAPAKVYQSKQPSLLPPEKADPCDLFSQRPSPSVDELKAHAAKRLEPGADRPLQIGMCCEGVIGSYDEAYRLSVKTGKPLRVLVGQPMSLIMAQGKRDDGVLKCRVDEGLDPRFKTKGVFEYQPGKDGKLYQAAAKLGDPKACTECSDPNCSCGCNIGGQCKCSKPTTNVSAVVREVPPSALPQAMIDAAKQDWGKYPTYHYGWPEPNGTVMIRDANGVLVPSRAPTHISYPVSSGPQPPPQPIQQPQPTAFFVVPQRYSYGSESC